MGNDEQHLPGLAPEQPEIDPLATPFRKHARPKLKLVERESGEIVDCPNCEFLDGQLAGAEKEIKAWRTRYQNLKKDRDAEARKSPQWPKALGIFRYWQQRTGHSGAHFTTERFLFIERFLKTHGAEDCRRAIDAVAQDDWRMKRGRHKNRRGGVHDGIKMIFRDDDDHFEALRDEVAPKLPTISGQSMIEVANEIASRVLERAELIRADDDPIAVAHLLVEINRELVRWHAIPKGGTDGSDDPTGTDDP